MSAVLPHLPEPFRWVDRQIGLTLPGGEVRFTTRLRPDTDDPIATLDLGTWDEPGDPDGAVAALARIAGVGARHVAQSRQEHGARVRVLRGEGDLATPGDHDAQVTDLPGVACVVRVADCVPVALVAREAVGAVHAGWRGLDAGVIGETIAALRGAGAGEIRAAIGPAAGVCCYETGDEVHAAFARYGTAARHGSHADLKAVARAQLTEHGVVEIHDTGLCTMCAPPGLLWSHRRDHGRTGRQTGMAWRS